MNCLPERHLQVLPSPHIHLFIIGAQVPEGFPRYSKQASSHCRGSRIEEKKLLAFRKKNASFYMYIYYYIYIIYLVGAIGLPLLASSSGDISIQVKCPPQVNPPTCKTTLMLAQTLAQTLVQTLALTQKHMHFKEKKGNLRAKERHIIFLLNLAPLC